MNQTLTSIWTSTVICQVMLTSVSQNASTEHMVHKCSLSRMYEVTYSIPRQLRKMHGKNLYSSS